MRAPRSLMLALLLAPFSVSAQQLPAAAQFETRLSDLEREIRTITGKMEALEHHNDELRSQLENLQKEMELRFNEVNQAAAAPAEETKETQSAPARTGDGTRTLGTVKAEAQQESGPKTPQQEYDDAFALLRNTQYEDAINAFNGFLQKHPEHELSGNAYYWLGEAYYVQDNFEKASVQFARGFQTFPKGNKAPDNLLKLALSLEKMGKKPEACTTLDKLGREFPDLKGTLRKKADETRKNLKCS